MLLVANLGSERLHGHVLCVAETRPTPCSARSDVLELDIPGGMVARASIAPVSGDLINVVVVPDGEERRVLVLAGTRRFHTGATAPAAAWSPPTQATEVMDTEAFGCGTVWLVDRPEPHDGYQPLRGVDRSDPLWLIYEPCPGSRDALAQLVLISDSREPIVIGAGHFATPTTTIAVEISEMIPDTTSTLQAALLPADTALSPSFSQAVTFG